MNDIQQDGPNDRVQQLFEELRQTPDAATADALEEMLVARLSHANSNGRKPDAMTTIALPHRDSRKSDHRFRSLVGWAALALVLAGIGALLAIRPPDGGIPQLSGASGTQDQTASDTDETFPPAIIENSEAFSMMSEITGRSYNITVVLPDDYNNPGLGENRYPVVYMIDSPFFNDAGRAIAIYTRVAAGRTSTTSAETELPKVIVVTIAMTGDEESSETESPDMWSEPDRFLTFVSQELIPRIDSRYRTTASADGRTIAGIGAGIANLVLIAMYTQTDMYSRYLAVSPGDSAPGFTVRELDGVFAATNTTLPARLFITSKDSGNAFFVERWHNMIAGHNYEGFESKYVAYDGPNVVANSFTAVFDGLRYLLNDTDEDQTAVAETEDVIGDGQPLVTLPNTETFNITSEITGREYQVFVSLPENYHSDTQQNRRYSVVYVLDGNLTFGSMHELNWLTDYTNELPSLIVVGIGYPTDHLGLRDDDMEQEPGLFLNFIGDELIPLIDVNYRTEASAAQRTLIGQAIGGKFVLYTLLNRPELFMRYVAAAFDFYDPDLDALESAFGTEPIDGPTKLFLGAAERESRGVELLYTTLQNQAYPGLQSTFRELDDLGYGASIVPLWTYGLMYVYDE